MNTYRNFTHNFQYLEAIKMPFNKLVDKQTMAHLDNVLLFSNKKKKRSSQATQDMKKL